MIPVFDAGALIALERRDRRMTLLLREFERSGVVVMTSAAVVAQVWRDGARQHAVARLVRSEFIRAVPLDIVAGLRVGALLQSAGTSDVVDAHVALIAQQVHGTVFTSDPDDFRALALRVEIVPL